MNPIVELVRMLDDAHYIIGAIAPERDYRFGPPRPTREEIDLLCDEWIKDYERMIEENPSS